MNDRTINRWGWIASAGVCLLALVMNTGCEDPCASADWESTDWVGGYEYRTCVWECSNGRSIYETWECNGDNNCGHVSTSTYPCR